MKQCARMALILITAVLLAACAGGQPLQEETAGERRTPWPAASGAPAEQAENDRTHRPEEEGMHMDIWLGEQRFTATLADNEAARAFARLLGQGPLTLAMRDYAGFEKVGGLGQSLPASDSPITAQAGDIMLYNGDQIVVFYGTNAWSYTRLGRMDSLDGWQQALGSGDVTVTFALPQETGP